MLGFAIMIFGANGARAVGCPNEMLRIGQSSTTLPDCRAYELVSPSGSAPYLENPSDAAEAVRASSAGGAIAWFSYNPLSSALGGGFYDLSIRGTSGWETQSVGPRLSTSNSGSPLCTGLVFFSADLSRGILSDGYNSPGVQAGEGGGSCGANTPPLVEHEPEGFQNVLLRDSSTGEYSLVNVTPAGVIPSDAFFEDASEDFSHVVFEDNAQLVGGAPPGAALYEWVGGVVHLVTVLPDGTSSTGALPGGDSPPVTIASAVPYTHPVSADGTRVVFESESKLYLRKNVEQEQSAVGPGGECLESAKACTVQLDASQAGGAGGGGSFLAANVTDTEIFFTDGAEQGLTADTAPGSGGEATGQHLYRYDTQTGQLTDLTPAGELGLLGLSGVSSDGSHLYLVAQAALAQGATPGQPNLYLFQGATVTHIATLAPGSNGTGDNYDWEKLFWTVRVSSDGRYLAFTSIENLTNSPGQTYQEIYLYDSTANTLNCVSCAAGGTQLGPAAIDRAIPTSLAGGPNYMQRNLLDDGRVFFDTASPLLQGATNGRRNVYEYANGRLSLISSGSSDTDSFFYDASVNGEDVYFVTTQHLVSGDTANGMRLYDARVDGGFTEPEPSLAPCGGEGCRNPASGSAPLLSTATANLQASGNIPLHLAGRGVVLTRRRKLKRALRACRRARDSRKQASCRRNAERRYGERR